MTVQVINKAPIWDESYYNSERKTINDLEHLTRVNSHSLKLPSNLVQNN